MIAEDLIRQYNQTRDCTDHSVLCHAPFTNLYFDQSGRGQACCFNAHHPLGAYPQDSIHDMWFGEKAQALRDALKKNDLTQGCRTCHNQVTSRNFPAHMSMFDRHINLKTAAGSPPIPSAESSSTEPAYPLGMEFSLSNTCNLECVMCSGALSSSIRQNRDKLPPIPNVYDDAFVEQLEDFIPSLIIAKFYGGEPF
ncbi:MAG: SPASM domain-containing protein, partial [Verrucomicrobiota bacterium]